MSRFPKENIYPGDLIVENFLNYQYVIFIVAVDTDKSYVIYSRLKDEPNPWIGWLPLQFQGNYVKQ